MSKKINALVLQTLRWDVDSLVYLYEYDAYYWLKPRVNNGKRTGITSCCEHNNECSHHKDIRAQMEKQNETNN